MRKLLAVSALLFTQSIFAAPFDACPSQAFLIQGAVPQAYAVNLSTGDYRVENTSMGTRKAVNAAGFNPADNYIYAWGYEHGAPVRVHDDFTIEPLEVDNIAGTNFYIGDVHPHNNHYYVYRQGRKFGLYSINLDQDASDYLQMKQITGGASLPVKGADIAINPADGVAYLVSSGGDLYSVDLDTGDSALLDNVGETGFFGAAYFDPDGNMYISRNGDGVIFRIAIGAGDYRARHFASGPSSNVNDGARCANALIVDTTDLDQDFGDAPDSYGTYLASNGARHGLTADPKLFLGEGVDGEADSFAFPLSDDQNNQQDDEDGVQFATAIVEGDKAVAIVTASAAGYISGWIDVGGDGVFDAQDQVLTDVKVEPGKQALYLEVPGGVVEGKTWARFRLSSETGLYATGGVADGEVEDYQVEVRAEEVTVNHYPSATGWTTVAFEDNWPLEGDYDMNDLVVYMRTAVASTSFGVKQVNISGEVAAVGAAYHNGFAIRLPGVKYSQVDLANVRYTINGKPVDFEPIEGGRDEAILMVTYNLWDYVGTGDLCLYYRTEPGCGSSIQMKFEAELPMLEPVDVTLRGVMDPFLFATPGAWHGGHFMTAPGRAYEIHLKNQKPTEAFDLTLFDEPGDDVSDPAHDTYFQTENGLPWALEIGTRWDYPTENGDVGHAYRLFSRYASSGGLDNSYWYNPQFTTPELIFSNHEATE